MKIVIKYLILLFVCLNSHAQNTGENKLGAWYMYHGNHKITDKFSLHTGAQLRTYELFDNFNVLLFYAGSDFSISPNISAGMGYGYLKLDLIYTENGEPDTKENRIYEQVNLKNKLKKLDITNRLRFEQRFLNVDGDNSLQHRIRYRLNLKHPLTDIFYLIAYNELIFTTDKKPFQQNRLFGAIGIKASNNINIQLGYMKNDFKTKSFDRLQVGLILKTDHRK